MSGCDGSTKAGLRSLARCDVPSGEAEDWIGVETSSVASYEASFRPASEGRDEGGSNDALLLASSVSQLRSYSNIVAFPTSSDESPVSSVRKR